MAPDMATKLMQQGKITSAVPFSSKENTARCHLDNLALETAESADSSIFSGLDGSLVSPAGSLDDEMDNSSEATEFENIVQGGPGGMSKKVDAGRKKENQLAHKNGSRKVLQSTADNQPKRNNSGNRHSNRNFDIGNSSARESFSSTKSAAEFSFDASTDSSTQKGSHYSQHGYDTCASTASYGSTLGVRRSKGAMKLISEVDMIEGVGPWDPDGVPVEEVRELPTPVGEERITNLLKEHQREMDESIASFKEDDETFDVLAGWQGMIPRRAHSEDDGHILSYSQVKKMKKVLHEARREMESLREHNETYISEIEQLQESHKSDLKLYEERTKQRLSEMKEIHRREVELLYQEKDAAIAEAGRQAVDYAEAGRQKVAHLKKQIQKYEFDARWSEHQSMEIVVDTVKKDKYDEMVTTLAAVQRSHELELERFETETETRIKNAVDEAVSSVTQKMKEDHDRTAAEMVNARRGKIEREKAQCVQKALATKRVEIAELHHERDSIVKALISVKENIHKHYPKQMAELQTKVQSTPNPMELIQSGRPPEKAVEKLFKQVMESFAFLLETSEKKAESSSDSLKIRKEIMMKHRAEMENVEKTNAELTEKGKKLEESLRNMGREKRVLEDRLRRTADTNRVKIRKLKQENQALKEAEGARGNSSPMPSNGLPDPPQSQVSEEEPSLCSTHLGNESGLPKQDIDGTHSNKERSRLNCTDTCTINEQSEPRRRDDVSDDKANLGNEDELVKSGSSMPTASTRGGVAEGSENSVAQCQGHGSAVNAFEPYPVEMIERPPTSPVQVHSSELDARRPLPPPTQFRTGPCWEVFPKNTDQQPNEVQGDTSSDSNIDALREQKLSSAPNSPRNSQGPPNLKIPERENGDVEQENSGNNDTNEAVKRRTIPILKGFKTPRALSPRSRAAGAKATGKEPDGKSDSHSQRRRSKRFRNFFESIGKGDSSHRRRSINTEDGPPLPSQSEKATPSCHQRNPSLQGKLGGPARVSHPANDPNSGHVDIKPHVPKSSLSVEIPDLDTVSSSTTESQATTPVAANTGGSSRGTKPTDSKLWINEGSPATQLSSHQSRAQREAILKARRASGRFAEL